MKKRYWLAAGTAATVAMAKFFASLSSTAWLLLGGLLFSLAVLILEGSRR